MGLPSVKSRGRPAAVVGNVTALPPAWLHGAAGHGQTFLGAA